MEDFKPLELIHKPLFDRFLSREQPRTSELTFTNLFMWRNCYGTTWAVREGCLLIILKDGKRGAFGLPPIGGDHKAAALDSLVVELRKMSDRPLISRAGRDLVENYADATRYEISEDRDNSDYVYLARDLITLSGNRFHGKKNHVNRFVKNYRFEYKELDSELVRSFLDLQETWCELRNCDENPGLMDENGAIIEALKNYEALGYKGGAILIDSKVEAFSLGEMLNHDTAVIHIEKANPEIPGLYAAISQRFCQAAWSGARFVNREQDLGIETLRKAKLSYNPDHLEAKYTLVPKGN